MVLGDFYKKISTVLVTLLLLVIAFSPILSSSDYSWATSSNNDETGNGGLYHYEFVYDKNSRSFYSKGTTSISNSKVNGEWTVDVGDWGWGSDGYGPFNSFYAAFDLSDNHMICHLDPYDLSKSVDGKVTIQPGTCNIMWVIPTLYWKVVNDE